MFDAENSPQLGASLCANFLDRSRLPFSKLSLQLSEQRHPPTAWRKVFLYLPVPLQLVKLFQPRSQLMPVLSAQLTDLFFNGLDMHILTVSWNHGRSNPTPKPPAPPAHAHPSAASRAH